MTVNLSSQKTISTTANNTFAAAKTMTNPISVDFQTASSIIDTKENDKQMVKSQLSELINQVRNLKEDSSKDTKKIISEKIKNLKEYAEMAEIDLGPILGELLANTNEKDKKQITKALGIKATEAEVEEPKQENNFFKNLFGNFGTSSISNNFNTKSNLPAISESGYDPVKAAHLAEVAQGNAGAHSTGYCARGVMTSLIESGLLSNWESGHAFQMPQILGNKENFKEIKVPADDVKNLPAGCVLVYGKGVAGYSKDYGHTAITLGDGRAASDFVQKNIKSSDQVRVFVPV